LCSTIAETTGRNSGFGDFPFMVDVLLALAFVAMILSPPIFATVHRGRSHKRHN
jgi:hypothetical protein